MLCLLDFVVLVVLRCFWSRRTIMAPVRGKKVEGKPFRSVGDVLVASLVDFYQIVNNVKGKVSHGKKDQKKKLIYTSILFGKELSKRLKRKTVNLRPHTYKKAKKTIHATVVLASMSCEYMFSNISPQRLRRQTDGSSIQGRRSP